MCTLVIILHPNVMYLYISIYFFLVRTCNDIPCPPRWDVSNFTSCSKSCGSGIQKRGVNCIQEVRHGVNNILQVDPRFCPSPAPIAQQYCNIIDCPVQWITGSWTKVIYLNCRNMACTN